MNKMKISRLFKKKSFNYTLYTVNLCINSVKYTSKT